MSRARWQWLLLLLAASGCTITARTDGDSEGPSNACESDSDCANRNCNQGVCQALNGQLESLLVQVTPTSDSGLPHIPFATHLDAVPTSGGERNITLVRAAHVRGRLKPADGSDCQPTFLGPEGNELPVSTDGQSYPVAVTLTPRNQLLGLPTQSYLADATRPSITKVGVEYIFEVQVPAGDYDIYVEPVAHRGCSVPPQLFRSEPIAEDVELKYSAAVTGSVNLEVHFPQTSGSLDGWVADVIEPISGNAISTEAELGDPAQIGSPNAQSKLLSYSVTLSYSSVVERGQSSTPIEGAKELVRLRPPPGVVAPTVLLDRSGLGLFQTDPHEAVVVDALTSIPSPVTLEGQLVRADDGTPARGDVTLVSKQIFGIDQGVFAAYQASFEVDDGGVFSITVPPGQYRVYAVPPLTGPNDSGLSAFEASWEVPADVAFQAGRLLELRELTLVSGQTPLQGAAVDVVAAPQSILPFEQAFGSAAFIPRARPGLVDQAGRFTIEADPGKFNLSVRPPESSGFAWLVRPGLEVLPGASEQDLGRLGASPAPSLVTGVASVGESTPVTSALIRAYAYLDKDLMYTRDPDQARSVIQVAETRADETGAFRLLVPANVAAPK